MPCGSPCRSRHCVSEFICETPGDPYVLILLRRRDRQRCAPFPETALGIGPNPSPPLSRPSHPTCLPGPAGALETPAFGGGSGGGAWVPKPTARSKRKPVEIAPRLAGAGSWYVGLGAARATARRSGAVFRRHFCRDGGLDRRATLALQHEGRRLATAWVFVARRLRRPRLVLFCDRGQFCDARFTADAHRMRRIEPSRSDLSKPRCPPPEPHQ